MATTQVQDRLLERSTKSEAKGSTAATSAPTPSTIIPVFLELTVHPHDLSKLTSPLHADPRADADRELQDIERLKSWIRGEDEFNHSIHERNQAARYEGTCSWLFDTPEFQSWTSLPPGSESTLWLQGKAGAGKSVLCSAAIDHVDQHKLGGIAFFFLGFNSTPTRLRLLRSLADQLLYECCNKGTRSLQDLTAFLRSRAYDARNVEKLVTTMVDRSGPTYIFIDGLNQVGDVRLQDEGIKDRTGAPGESQQSVDIQAVESFLSFVFHLARRPNSQLRLWCTTQDADPASQWMQKFHPPAFEIPHTAIADGIRALVRPQLTSKVCRMITHNDEPPDARFTVLEEILVKRAGHNFRWARLMLNDVCDADDADAFTEAAVAGFPYGIMECYSLCLERLPARDRFDEDRRGRRSQLSRYLKELSASYSSLTSPPRLILSIVAFAGRELDRMNLMKFC